MTPNSLKETNRILHYQSLFRLLVGFAGILSLLTFHRGLEHELIVTLPLLVTIGYILSSHFLLQRVSPSSRPGVGTVLSFIDALLLGGLICLIDLSLLPALLLIITLQFNGIIGGGFRKLRNDNLALLLGIAITALLRFPQWTLSADILTGLPPLLALGIYICIYGASSSREIATLGEKQKELEKTQVQLKLRNYRLSKYLSPTLLKAIQSGKDVKLETHRKKLTVFFSDIKGFSELAEELEGDVLTSLLNNYLSEMSQIALQHGGTIDKFIGDAIMVFFGDPTSNGVKADCTAAVSMAIAMKKHMKELQRRWASQGIETPMEIRMGLNTGYCAVGNFGTENRLDYTLLGTEVNLASRLESAAEPGEILISHETYSLVKDQIMCRDKGDIQIKGYQQPVRIYSVVDFRKNMGSDQSYFEHMTDGFSFYMDMDRIRHYDRDRIMKSLIEAAAQLKNKKNH